jgi:hypothetical protein
LGSWRGDSGIDGVYLSERGWRWRGWDVRWDYWVSF